MAHNGKQGRGEPGTFLGAAEKMGTQDFSGDRRELKQHKICLSGTRGA
jgi:hypothetical protein